MLVQLLYQGQWVPAALGSGTTVARAPEMAACQAWWVAAVQERLDCDAEPEAGVSRCQKEEMRHSLYRIVV